jgi:autotransporter-associated beta strand protein
MPASSRSNHFFSAMKINHSSRSPRVALVLGLFALLLLSSASAATLTWDANAGSIPNPSDGSGSWTSASSWWNGAAHVTWTAANDAVFGAGADGVYSINVTGLPVSAAQTIRFSNSGYTLTNGTIQSLQLSAASGATIPQLRIDSGKSATIGTNVTLEPNTAVILYVGATSPAAGGTLNIDNGGTVRNPLQSIIIDGVGTVLNVKTGGTLAQLSTGNHAVTLGQLTGANCTLNVQGGSVSGAGIGSISGMIVGNFGVAMVNLTGGSITMSPTANGLNLGRSGAAASGTFNLDGGTLSASLIKKGSGTNGVFNFNGGTLKALASQSAFMTGLTSANVKSGGAIIDDGGFAITIAQALLAGAPSGGLTKLGGGTNTLTGTNTYTGPTIVTAGTLAISTASRGGGVCVVSNGATLEVKVIGAGTSLTNSSLTLGDSGNLTNTFALGTNGSQTVPAIRVPGTLNLDGTVWVNVSATGLAAGTYPLLSYGSLTGAGSFQAGALPIAGSPVLTNNTAAKQLQLIVPAAPDVTFTQFPKPLQLYPRNLTNGFADVLVAGSVTSTGCTQIAVTVLRNGIAHTNFNQALTYSSGTAPFAITTPILAELASYTFEVRVTRNGTDYLVASASDVVAGDVFLINGQSNAEARMFSGSANGNQHPYLRSFGTPSDSGAVVAADLNWHLAEGDAWGTAGFVGQWGLRLGRLIIDNYGVPVAIINGARAGWPISSFLRNNANREDLETDYGRTLFRARAAGVQNNIRAVLWYQGESDEGDADAHEKCWLTLREDWREDFPAIEKFYVFQLHAGCGSVAAPLVAQFDADLRNRQRLFADRFADVEVMSTTAVSQHTDSCHFSYSGYATHAANIFRLVQRDLYGAAPQNNIEPPNPYYAYFNTPANNVITVIMRNAADTLTFTPSAQTNFQLVGSAVVVTAGVAVSNTLILTLSGDASTTTGLTYGGQRGDSSASIINANGVGLFAFYNLPIQPGLGAPSVPTNLASAAIGANRVDLTWTATTNAAEYLIRRDGVVIGKTTATLFTDLAVTPGPLYSYDLAAVSPVSTSAWSSVTSVTTIPDNVFSFVPEATNYTVLYQLDIPHDLRLGATLAVPYDVDQSAVLTQPFDRVAYYLELQTDPGQPLKWIYVSCDSFTTNSQLLGVPALAGGAIFHQPISNLNVFASVGSSIATGSGLGAGNIEFWGWNYTASNGYGVPGASGTTFDEGDLISTGGTYGSMQIHRAGETLFAYNSWGLYTADTGTQSSDDLGIGSQPTGEPDWTFAANSFRHAVKRLYVLVRPVTPIPLSYTQTGNQLRLSWPATSGWQLQAQTNSLATGLGPNWVTVSGSEATNQITLPVNLENGAVFFRLIYSGN